MFLRHGFLLIASSLSLATAHAAVYTVGADGACTHTTIADAAAAAESHPGADTIHVAYNQAYTEQAIVLSASEEVELIGGFADCSQAESDGSHTTIDGSGGDTEPVFRITGDTGSLVRISYLTIQGGDEDGSGKGGGIYFKGNGILELNHATVTQNIAGSGGGIYAEGTGGETELVIGVDVAITGNTARHDGGGVVNDGTEMTMTQPDSYIASNHAPDGYGGGLLVLSENRNAYTYLGSTGLGNLGPVYLNDANRGGGVAVRSGDDFKAELHLFSTDPARPVRIRSNTAASEGGGIDLHGDYARVIGWYAWIEDNLAPHGAAISLRDSEGSAFGVWFNDPKLRPLGSIDCPIGTPCGGIVGNAAEDGSAQPSNGVIEVGAFGFTRFHRMIFEGNIGKFLFRGDGPGDGGLGLETHHVAITGNTVSGELIATENDGGDDGIIGLYDTTIAGNSIGAAVVMRISNAYEGADQMFRTIIWQPGKTTLDLTGGPPLDLFDDMVSERDSVDGGNTPYVVVQDPRFVDPEHGDYSLRAGSPAVDSTTIVEGDDRDLDSNPRDIDLPLINYLGVRDLGAIERQRLQPLVLNPDFDADLRLWSTATPGVTTWDASRNVTGAEGSGSAHITLPNAVTGTRVGGIVECVHLPGPGTYSLNGWGRGTGTAFTAGDIALLYWEYRKSGQESCTSGAPDETGTLTLSNSPNWSRAPNPAEIHVSEQDWTYTSSIAVTLVAQENGPSGAPTNAWFDGVTLATTSDDVIFADDFDGI
jgi:predicted outer membrane repeat protein